jgi:hypothetical protein
VLVPLMPQDVSNNVKTTEARDTDRMREKKRTRADMGLPSFLQGFRIDSGQALGAFGPKDAPNEQTTGNVALSLPSPVVWSTKVPKIYFSSMPCTINSTYMINPIRLVVNDEYKPLDFLDVSKKDGYTR